mgnify:CR=1 FL=1
MIPDNAWRSYVRMRRKWMPETNNGRTVKVYDYTTKRGQEIMSRAWKCEAFYLAGIYDTPSTAKQKLYDDVYEMYMNDEEADNFHICSHNSFQFTVAWDRAGEVVYVTRDTEYHVLINE